ncbi:MAG TPA: BatA domain-containing protein [Bacteroidales bacterium]|nr:BatA domain-containing protein [Bacteroidales bacterium]
MQFVNPLYLIGLLAIAIPIVVHLFNFRRFRRVYFTNVRFLQALRQQTRKQSQLRHLLILLMRILAIAALVFAFAQPYIPFNESQSKIAQQNVVSVFVDNSFSMEAAGSNGTLLDEARQKAREIVSAYKSSDLFQLLTCDFEGRHQRLVTRDEFLTMFDEVKTSPSVHTFDEIVSRQYDLLKNEPAARRTTYLVSDFQKSTYSPSVLKQDSAILSYLVPLKSQGMANVYIDTCWFAQPIQQPGKTSVLRARIWNRSETDLEKIPLKLVINNQQKSVTSLDIKAGMSVTAEMPFTIRTEGPQQGLLQVTDYPVTYDDKFYFSFDVLSSVQVLCINGNGGNRFLDALYAQDSSVHFTNVGEKSLDYGRLAESDLIIMNEIPSVSSGLAAEIKRYVDNGGTILVLPAANADLSSYNSFLAMLKAPVYREPDTADTRVVRLSEESYLFRDVFEKQQGKAAIDVNTELPKVSRHFPIVFSSATLTVPMIEMLNGRSFLTLTNSGMGQIFQMAVPLDPAFSNFPLQALFVPVLYNIALISHPVHSLYSIIGDNKPLRMGAAIPDGEQVYKIKSPATNFEMIPQLTRSGNMLNVFVGNQVPEAGNYQLVDNNKVISGLSFNYNRNESNLECFPVSELETMLNKAHLKNFSLVEPGQRPLNEVIAQMNSGTQLWRYFVWLALAMLLGEILLIRFFKK